MAYKKILVHLDLNGDNESILKITADLAERFGSTVVGIAAAQPILLPLYDEGFAAADIATQHRNEVDKEIAACRVQFGQAMESRVREIEWHSAVTLDPLANYIARESRCADLIITGKDIGASLMDNSRRVNVGDLAIKAGRPVLIVPQGITALPLQQVFVGWKDTRESRRAVSDALPLLEAANHVTILEITTEDEQKEAQARVQDVGSWLENHGIVSTPNGVGTDSMEMGYLYTELLREKCDLLIAGAYGHNRLGEWIFGGITENILLDPKFCVLLSH